MTKMHGTNQEWSGNFKKPLPCLVNKFKTTTKFFFFRKTKKIICRWQSKTQTFLRFT